jgi:hypothetical protein
MKRAATSGAALSVLFWIGEVLYDFTSQPDWVCTPVLFSVDYMGEFSLFHPPGDGIPHTARKTSEFKKRVPSYDKQFVRAIRHLNVPFTAKGESRCAILATSRSVAAR